MAQHSAIRGIVAKHGECWRSWETSNICRNTLIRAVLLFSVLPHTSHTQSSSSQFSKMLSDNIRWEVKLPHIKWILLSYVCADDRWCFTAFMVQIKLPTIELKVVISCFNPWEHNGNYMYHLLSSAHKAYLFSLSRLLSTEVRCRTAL
jgi:hypothetical protein